MNAGRLGDAEADEEADRDEDDREYEGKTPTPGQEIVIVHGSREDSEQRDGDQEAPGHADMHERGEEAAAVRRRVLDRHRHAPAVLAADADALEQAQHDQRDWRGDADLRIGRHEADQESAEPHDQDGEEQRGLAADAVAEMAKQHAAKRPGAITDEERCEGEQRADQRIGARKEHLVEDERGRGRIQREVVILDHVADGAGQRHLANVARTAILDRGRRARHPAGHSESSHLAHDIPSRFWQGRSLPFILSGLRTKK